VAKDPDDDRTPDLLTEVLGAPVCALPLGHVVKNRTALAEERLQEIYRVVTARRQPIRIRTALHLWHPDAEHYKGWPGNSWTIQAANPDDARAFAEVLETVFDCLSVENVKVVLARVQELKEDLQAGATASPLTTR
jgi:hypothetical protein